jgi:hypothetical protein
MANRSYLYTRHPDEEPEYRDLAEWISKPPLAHLLLVGADPSVCPSAIWEVDAKLALQGDATQSRPLFLAFLDWLEPQLPQDFGDASKDAKKLLTRPDHQGAHFHLELGEVYELMGLDLDDMERETTSNAALAQRLFEHVRRLVETDGAILDDAVHEEIKKLKDNWEEHLGLHFSDTLYFHLGD